LTWAGSRWTANRRYAHCSCLPTTTVEPALVRATTSPRLHRAPWALLRGCWRKRQPPPPDYHPLIPRLLWRGFTGVLYSRRQPHRARYHLVLTTAASTPTHPDNTQHPPSTRVAASGIRFPGVPPAPCMRHNSRCVAYDEQHIPTHSATWYASLLPALVAEPRHFLPCLLARAATFCTWTCC